MQIDFQISHWGTPAIDVFYLLYTAASHDVRISSRNEIINFYFDEFTKTLTQLKYEKPFPTKDSLLTELRSCQIIEIWLLLGLCIFQYADFTKLNMKEIIADRSFYKISYSALENQNYIDQIQQMLRRYSDAKND